MRRHPSCLDGQLAAGPPLLFPAIKQLLRARALEKESAATSYLLGGSQGKEYAEPAWHIDIWLTVVWVAFLAVYLGTLIKRKEPHIYVANWFFGAFILAVALLHVVNSAAIPAGFMKSYSAYAGVQDAMVQWWYGHNAVAFFLTTPILGIMYYFVPKQEERPVSAQVTPLNLLKKLRKKVYLKVIKWLGQDKPIKKSAQVLRRSSHLALPLLWYF